MQDTNYLEWSMFVRFVQQWAKDRNLTSSTVQAQALKGLSELGELADNLAKGKCIKDDIGDNCVVAVIVDLLNAVPSHSQGGYTRDITPTEIVGEAAYDWGYYLIECSQTRMDIPDLMRELCQIKGLIFEECLATAWNDIKDRKGVLYEGVFIKDTDPRYAEVIKLLR